MSENKDDKWEMPKPVFRSSTGALPKSLEDTIHESSFPSADTVEISTDTVEIDEDDDILSILDTPSAAGAAEAGESDDFDGETTLAMDAEPEAEPEPELDPEPEPEPEVTAAEEEVPSATEPSKPVVVTAKKSATQPEPPRRGFGSLILIFILIAVLAAGIVAGLLYYLSRNGLTSSGPF